MTDAGHLQSKVSKPTGRMTTLRVNDRSSLIPYEFKREAIIGIDVCVVCVCKHRCFLNQVFFA